MIQILNGFETIERFHDMLYSAKGLEKIKAHPCNESLLKLLTHPQYGESPPDWDIFIGFEISEKEIQLIFKDRTEIIKLNPQ